MTPVSHPTHTHTHTHTQDKGPVGILCLAEYESCHKTEGKEWKKPNTFLLEKGKVNKVIYII